MRRMSSAKRIRVQAPLVGVHESAMEPRPRTVMDAMAGDADAFEDLVRAYNGDLKRVCYMITGDRGTAEDAAQITWEIAWRKLNQLRTPAKARQWLLAVAGNEARRLARRGAFLRPEDDRADSMAPRDLDLAVALSRLSAPDRQLLALTFLAGMSSGEAGGIMGLSPEGVRTRKTRILKRLRKELGDD